MPFVDSSDEGAVLLVHVIHEAAANLMHHVTNHFMSCLSQGRRLRFVHNADVVHQTCIDRETSVT